MYSSIATYYKKLIQEYLICLKMSNIKRTNITSIQKYQMKETEM